MTLEHLQNEIYGFFGSKSFYFWLKLTFLDEFEVEDVVDEGQEQVDLLDDKHDNSTCMLTHDITQKALQENQADAERRSEFLRHAQLVVH